LLFFLIILKKRGEELKGPYHASAAAVHNGNLPHVTATCHTWWQYALYSDHLSLFLTETIYRNIILVRLALERYIGVKGLEANLGKRNLSYSIVNAIGDKYLRALRRTNKGRKYNSNTLKDRNNRTKRLALLGGCPSR